MPSCTINLEGKVAIVTGGTRGIGRHIAQAFLDAGCAVAICGRNPPEDPVQSGGRSADFYACDIRKAEEAKKFVDAVAEKYGRLDIVINNAGGSPQAAAATASPRFSEAIIALNLLAPLHIAQAAYHWMEKQEEGGSIVNIASVSAVRPSPDTAVYGAAKAGLLSLTKSLAQEWGAKKIRVNAIIVGLIETEITEMTYGTAEAQRRLAATLPLGRMGHGSDIAAAALYLSSPLASYVSGAQLSVDGGGERPLFLEIVAQALAESEGKR